MIKIYRAVKSNLLRQGFGLENTFPALLPLYQSLGLKGHDGWDWMVTCKDYSVQLGGQCEKVYCDLAEGATITYIAKDVKTGFGIIAIDTDGDKHLWWHFDSIRSDLIVGSKINGGDVLGVAGNTGYSTGAHLHRGYYRYDEPYDNGYHGAVDMTPYFQNIFILDFITQLQQKIGILQMLINLWHKITGK